LISLLLTSYNVFATNANNKEKKNKQIRAFSYIPEVSAKNRENAPI